MADSPGPTPGSPSGAQPCWERHALAAAGRVLACRRNGWEPDPLDLQLAIGPLLSLAGHATLAGRTPPAQVSGVLRPVLADVAERCVAAARYGLAQLLDFWSRCWHGEPLGGHLCRGSDLSGPLVQLLRDTADTLGRARHDQGPPDGAPAVEPAVVHRLLELSATQPAIAAVLRATLCPAGSAHAAALLDHLAHGVLVGLETGLDRVHLAALLVRLGARGEHVDAQLSSLRALAHQLGEVEPVIAGDTQLRQAAALAREAVEEGHLDLAEEFAAACLDGAERIGFQQRLAGARRAADRLPASDHAERLRAAEVLWTRADTRAVAWRQLAAVETELGLGAEPAAGPTASDTQLHRAKQRYEAGAVDAAVELVWPDRNRCPSGPARYLLFRIFREQRRIASARELLAVAQAAGDAGWFDHHNLARVAVATRHFEEASRAHERAAELGGPPAWLRVVERELPSTVAVVPDELLTATPEHAVEWVARHVEQRLADSDAAQLDRGSALALVLEQATLHGAGTGGELVTRLEPVLPGLVEDFLARTDPAALEELPPEQRTTLWDLVADRSSGVVLHHVHRLRAAGHQFLAVELLQRAVRRVEPRGRPKLQGILLRSYHELGFAEEAEALATEALPPWPDDKLLADTGAQTTPLPQPRLFGRAAVERSGDGDVHRWLRRAGNGAWHLLTAALYHAVRAGRAAEGLRLAAAAPVQSLVHFGVIWNIGCAYAHLGQNEAAADAFHRHAALMDQPYLMSDAAAVAAVCDAAGRPRPELPVVSSGHRARRPAQRFDDQPAQSPFADRILLSRRWIQQSSDEELLAEIAERCGRHPAWIGWDEHLDREFLLRDPRPVRSRAGKLGPETGKRVAEAERRVAAEDWAGARDALLAALYLQPTHLGLLADTVAVLLRTEEFDHAERVADAGGERAHRHDLLAAVRAARGDRAPAVGELLRAQAMAPTPERACAVARLALRAGDSGTAVDALTAQLDRHLPGTVPIAAAFLIRLSRTEPGAVGEDLVRSVLARIRQRRRRDELIEWVIEHRAPAELAGIRGELGPDTLDRLATAFADEPVALLAAVHTRLAGITGADQARARQESYLFLVTTLLDRGELGAAARHYLDFELEFGAELAGQAFPEHPETRFTAFRRVYLETKLDRARSDRRIRVGPGDRAELERLRRAVRVMLPAEPVRRFHEAADELAELATHQLVAEDSLLVEAAVTALRAAVEGTADAVGIDELVPLWYELLDTARPPLLEGRPPDRAERGRLDGLNRRIRRCQQTLTIPRVEQLAQQLGKTLYRAWQELNRPRLPAPVSSFAHQRPAPPGLFTGRQEPARRIAKELNAIPARGLAPVCAVHGPPRIGKTSLLHTFLEPNSHCPAHVLPARIVAPGADEDFYAALATQLHRRGRRARRRRGDSDALPDIPVPKGVANLDDLLDWLDHIPDGWGWLVVVDPLDGFAADLAAHGHAAAFAELLHEVTTFDRYPVGFLLAARVAPARLLAGLGARIEPITVELGPLEATQTRHLVHKGLGEVEITPGAHERFQALTAGHPYHLHQLGAEVVRQWQAQDMPYRPVDSAVVDAAAGALTTVSDAHIGPLAYFADERRGSLLRRLANVLVSDDWVWDGMVLDALDSGPAAQSREQLQLLHDKGVVVWEDTENRVRWTNPLVGRWVVGRYAEEPAGGGSRIPRMPKAIEARLRAAGYPLDWGRPVPFRAGGAPMPRVRAWRDGQPFTVVAVRGAHGEVRARATALLRRAFDRSDGPQRRYLADWVDDEHVVLRCPPGERTLDELVPTEPVTAARAVDWVIQAAHAVAEAHRAGLVHGSLSLDSLYLVEDRVWVEGWLEAALAEAGHSVLRARGVPGYRRREYGGPEDPPLPADDGFALTVCLWRLLDQCVAPDEQSAPGRPPRFPFAEDDPLGTDGRANLFSLSSRAVPAALRDLVEDALREDVTPAELRNRLLAFVRRTPADVARGGQDVVDIRLQVDGDGLTWDTQGPVRLHAHSDALGLDLQQVQHLPGPTLVGLVQDLAARPGHDRIKGMLGKQLASVLFGLDETELRERLRTVRDRARIRLWLETTTDVHQYPWELALVHDNLNLGEAATVIRFPTDPDVLVHAPVESVPPEVFVLLGRPGSRPPRGMTAGLPTGSGHTLSDLLRSHHRCTVFQYLGEGEPGTLLVGAARRGSDGPVGKPCDLTVLGDALYGWRTRLALLTGCHTATPSVVGPSVALSLVRSGIPAVVGMQALVQTDTTARFAQLYLASLRKHGDVELAFHLACQRQDDSVTSHAGVPVLFLASRHTKLFHVSVVDG
ncbi:hypothetical protein GCM10012275_45970 [Longimycelium tulufanense]|uniref:Protein kinase domain-containing protein n=1 Tax=Longimycelium tulufanense TaxID=907463 RepID=A0A8J3CHI8_9PSEU|nr:hypothetical protein [Longimycelium tulufanense]GGM70408.1 hypothetical protein GCM10012275_45970 [Longimycelium tulufanense]